MSHPIFPKVKHDKQNGKTQVDTKPLSFQELHKELQARLQKQGIINDMRADLRNRLVHELYEIAEPDQVPKISSGEETDSQLPLQISNWLVCNHFQRGKFEFTLSTFLRESGIVTLPEFNMTFHDVLYIFGIHPNTSFYQAIQEKYSSEKNSGGLLFLIVQELLLCVLPQSMKGYSETFTQTDSSVTNEEKAHMKVLQEIEYLRLKLDQELKSVLSEKPKQELTRKDFICINCSKEVQDGLSLLDLQKKEIDRLESLLKSAENDVKKRKEVLEEELLLKAQEIEKRILLQWQKGEGDFKVIQGKFFADEKRVKEGEIVSEELRSNLDKSQLRVRELESQLKVMKEQMVILQNQNKSLQAMLESMADYEVIKSDLNVRKRELELALSRYQDSQNQWLNVKEILEKKVADLTLKITSPCLELLTANTEVQKVLEKQEQDQSNWNLERSHLQKEINQAKLRLLEQKQHIENQSKVIYNLQLQSGNTALRDMQTDIVFADRRLTSPKIPSPVSPLKPVFSKDSSSSTLSSQSKTSYLQEAKTRIEKLQAEADSLERKYSQCLKNQRTLLSPSEAFFSPLAKPKNLFSNLSFPNTNVTVANENTNFFYRPFGPTAPNVLFEENYQVTKSPEYLIGRTELPTKLPTADNKTQPIDPAHKSVVVQGVQPVYDYDLLNLHSHLNDLQKSTIISSIEEQFGSDNRFDVTSPIVKGKTVSLEISGRHRVVDDTRTNLEPRSSESVSPPLNHEIGNQRSSLKLNPRKITLNEDEQPFKRNVVSFPNTDVSVSLFNTNRECSELTNTLEDPQMSREADNLKHDTPAAIMDVNLDAEWKKATAMPSMSAQAPPTNIYAVNLDREWKKQSTNAVTSVSHTLQETGNLSEAPENVSVHISSDTEGNLVSVEGAESFPVLVDENVTGEHGISDLRSKDFGSKSGQESLKNGTNNLHVESLDSTTGTLAQNSRFVPEIHSTPAVATDSKQDASENSENGKVSSEIDLSIGDQKLHSGNSGSESPW